MANAQRLLIMIAIILFFGAGVYLIVGGVRHYGRYDASPNWTFDELEIAFGFVLVKASSLINAEYKRHKEKTSL